MSWITPAGCVPAVPAGLRVPAGWATCSAIGHLRTPDSGDLRSTVLRRVREELLHPMPALLEPVETQAEIDHEVADQVVQVLAGKVQQQSAVVESDGMSVLREAGGEGISALLDLHGQHLAVLGEGSDGSVPQQPAAVDRHE